MTTKNERLTCDNCGREVPLYNDVDWAEVTVKPKGIKVVLDLCPVCVQARLPKPPAAKPFPILENCRNSLQVAGFLLWETGQVDEIHLPTRKSAIVTTKIGDDRWRVLRIYEDTSEAGWQLSNVMTHLSNNYSDTWNESYKETEYTETREDIIERVKWCCEQLLDSINAETNLDN